MLKKLKDLREWWNGLDDELDAMYAEHEKNLAILAKDKAGYNRRDRRHLDGFVPAQNFGHVNQKIGMGAGYSKVNHN